MLTTWVTFVPCFMFVFLGAPSIERLRGNRHVAAALSGITAVVVGVIANLAVYFAEHTLFTSVHTAAFGPLTLQLPDPTTVTKSCRRGPATATRWAPRTSHPLPLAQAPHGYGVFQKKQDGCVNVCSSPDPRAKSIPFRRRGTITRHSQRYESRGQGGPN
ncbi:chromate transporter [Streptomyces sp. HMX87]|uniref:chromate transporter n=1 Tax=Streptomyces sp. HMX87 TaxID=3390849 RepID=UPI003A862746